MHKVYQNIKKVLEIMKQKQNSETEGTITELTNSLEEVYIRPDQSFRRKYQ